MSFVADIIVNALVKSGYQGHHEDFLLWGREVLKLLCEIYVSAN